MKLPVVLFVFCAVLSVDANSDGLENKDANSTEGITGSGLQLVLSKFDVLSTKLQTMEDKLQKLEDHVGRVLQIQNNVIPSSCKDILAATKVSGTYLIRIKTDSEPFPVHCEQKAHGGGWIVIQHRFNGSLDFYRGWNEFRDGFGDLDKEFWLGLEKVHQITKARRHEVIVELKDFSGKYKYAQNDDFEIGNESEAYALKELGSYDGTADDGLWMNRGMKFSTKDRDNDLKSDGQCAQIHEGAWWHKDCTKANLNGRYVNANDAKSMFWYDFDYNHYGLSFSRMMIREEE